MVVLAMLSLATGVTLNVYQSEHDKGRIGPFGVFRPSSMKGFKKGLPFYVIGLILLLLAP